MGKAKMKASEMAGKLARDYAFSDTEAEDDWQTIPADLRRRFVLAWVNENNMALDVFSSDTGYAILRSMLALAAEPVPYTGKMARLVRTAMMEYQPPFDLFEKAREEWLLDTCVLEVINPEDIHERSE